MRLSDLVCALGVALLLMVLVGATAVFAAAREPAYGVRVLIERNDAGVRVWWNGPPPVQ